MVFREMQRSVFSVLRRKHSGTLKSTAVRRELSFGWNGKATGFTCQFLIEEKALTPASPLRTMVSGFGAWRNVCDFWEANWRFNLCSWKELKLTHGYRSRLPANARARVDAGTHNIALWQRTNSSVMRCFYLWTLGGWPRLVGIKTNRLPHASRCSKRGHSCCQGRVIFHFCTPLFHGPANPNGSSVTATPSRSMVYLRHAQSAAPLLWRGVLALHHH